MNSEQSLNYCKIAELINYLNKRLKTQTSLFEISENTNLSTSNFERLLAEWAGISPEKFQQYISIDYARKLLRNEKTSLFENAFETKPSIENRLHKQFITLERMTTPAYKGESIDLKINYSFADSCFGTLIIASTHKGICYIAFENDEIKAVELLKSYYLNAHFQEQVDIFQQNALLIFNKDNSQIEEVKLHIRATDFQFKVWENLLDIPMGKLATYGEIALKVGNSKASRAVGTAIGCNPVAFLIPCHRVIQSTGNLGGYMWGTTRKTAIIAWEAAKMETENMII